MVDPFSGFQAGDDAIFLADAFGGDDERNMTAHRLLGSVAEETFRRGVPALNDAVQRLADDGVVRRLDDRREEPGRLTAGSSFSRSMRRCALTSRKIRTHPETWPCSSLIGAALSSIGRSPPSFLDQHRVIRQTDDDSLPEGPCRRAFDRPASVFVDDPKHLVERLTDGVLLRPTCQRLSHRIQVGDATVDRRW